MSYTKAHLDAIDQARRLRRLDVAWPDGRRTQYASPEAMLQVRNDIEFTIAKADLQAVKTALAEGALEVRLSSETKRVAASAELEALRDYISRRVLTFSIRKPVPQRRVILSPFLA